MVKMGKQTTAASTADVLDVRNVGEPLRFKDVEPLAGVAAEPTKAGQAAKILTQLAIDSDVPLFHRLVDNFDGVVRHMAEKTGYAVNVDFHAEVTH